MLIITGCPRSGTTAIMNLLNSCPDIKITQELSGFDQFLPEEVFIERTKDPEILALLPGIKDLYDRLPYKIVGDKLPGYCLPQYHSFLLSKDFRYVFCMRNCRGFVDSSIRYFKQGYTNSWCFETANEASCMWYNYNKSMIDLMLQVKPPKYVLMRYEESVLDIDHYLKRISTLLSYKINITDPSKYYYPVNIDAGKELNKKDFSPHAVALMEILGYE